MIAQLTGTLTLREGARGIIDVRGVGYEVFAPQKSLNQWEETGREIVAHIFTHVREDAITLYGFESAENRRGFRTLLGVSGVGPKVALATLDTLSMDGLCQAVETDDVRALSAIPGVGKKVAQRLALELKGKLIPSFSPSSPTAIRGINKKADPLPLALARLGYTKSEIDRAAAALHTQGIDPSSPVGPDLSTQRPLPKPSIPLSVPGTSVNLSAKNSWWKTCAFIFGQH
jgi:Holliday junction DNA helicase RuvA